MATEERFSQRHPLRCNPDASMYPMNPIWCIVTVDHNARVIVYIRRQTERGEAVKERLEGDMESDGWDSHQAWSNSPPVCLSRLWLSSSTATEPFCLDGIIFHWYGNAIWSIKCTHGVSRIHQGYQVWCPGLVYVRRLIWHRDIQQFRARTWATCYVDNGMLPKSWTIPEAREMWIPWGNSEILRTDHFNTTNLHESE